VHLAPEGPNAVTLYSYPGNTQSWGAVYAIDPPDGVLDPASSSPSTSARPRF